MPTRAQRKLWRSLLRRKGRLESGLFLVEGPRLLPDLLASDVQVEALLCSRAAGRDSQVAELASRFESAGAQVEWLSERELEAVTATVTPQGVAAVARIPRSDWASVRGPQMLMLDGIQDPGNVGTLIRTGEALGVRVVVCLPGTADPWGPKAVRAAAGSCFRLPVSESSGEEALARLRALDAALWVADAGGEPVHRGADRPARLALALGSEAHGVSDTLRGHAQRIVSIGMEAPVDSLNVAVAGAILMDRIFGSERNEAGGQDAGRNEARCDDAGAAETAGPTGP